MRECLRYFDTLLSIFSEFYCQIQVGWNLVSCQKGKITKSSHTPAQRKLRCVWSIQVSKIWLITYVGLQCLVYEVISVVLTSLISASQWRHMAPYIVFSIDPDIGLWHHTLVARFMGLTWGPPGADRTQVDPMLAPWSLISGHTS